MTRARNLARLGNRQALSVDSSLNVGVNSTSPVSKLNVVGIVSATAFYGDGSNLDGVASAGLGTAVSETAPGDVIYYTNTILGITTDITVDPPSSTNVAYTQYAEISVDDGIDFIIADGDDFVPDILGLSTEGVTPLSGAGGRIRAGSFTNKAGTGAPKLTFGAEIPVGYGITGAGGLNITGIVTAGGFVGNLTGNVTGNATGLTGSPSINVTNITSTGNVSIAGTLTYEDVTNVDSIGIITARSGVDLNALLREQVNITAGKLSDNTAINVDNGMVHYFTTTETTTSTPNIYSSVGINTQMGVGDAMAVTIITTAAAAGYSTCVNIDNAYNDVKWLGGSDPSTGGASGIDVYALQVIKTASATYTVLGSLNNFA